MFTLALCDFKLGHCQIRNRLLSEIPHIPGRAHWCMLQCPRPRPPKAAPRATAPARPQRAGAVFLDALLELMSRLGPWKSRVCSAVQSATDLERPQPDPRAGAVSVTLADAALACPALARIDQHHDSPQSRPIPASPSDPAIGQLDRLERRRSWAHIVRMEKHRSRMLAGGSDGGFRAMWCVQSISPEGVAPLILCHSALDINRLAGLRAVSAASRIVFRVNLSF
jgi:hypothetical protein